MCIALKIKYFLVPMISSYELVSLLQTKAEHQEQAERFLENQRKRICFIDESLLKSTEYILPPSPEAKTITELAELCRLVQEATRQKMGLLRTRLELLGVKTAWQDSITSPKVMTMHKGNKGNNQIHWSVGGPLDCVIETDTETDGATTPGSLLQPSPFASTTKRKTSLTPTTPTMNIFSFRYVLVMKVGLLVFVNSCIVLKCTRSNRSLLVSSSGTTSILEKMNIPSSQTKPKTPGRRLKASPSPFCERRRSERQLNFDGFQDEDDMISIYTSEPQTKVAQILHTSPLQELKEERSLFLARMESMLERVEEELFQESRPSDEISGLSRKNSLEQTIERPSNSKFLEELQEEDSVDDDSTNVIATLVAEKPQQLGGNIMRPVPIFQRPTHIVVDTAEIPSPTHTNITMDGTMMNETVMSTTILHDDDNDSTVTPILDRYRLDADDNSIGIKVVPNQRGKHAQRALHNAYQQTKAKASEFCTDSDGFLSPKGLPGSVSARKAKQYRKTPFPKKENSRSFDDENQPNTRTLAFSPSPSNTSSFDASNPESSFSVPPLRPRSVGPTRTKSRSQTTSRTQSLPVHTSLLQISVQPTVRQDESFSNWMEKVTKAEYNMAPRNIQMQVTRDEVNQSLDNLDLLLSSKWQVSQTLEFSEQEAYKVLSNILDSEQKSKSVLMSLCHWRRLLMFREGGKEMVFAVNKFD